MLRRFGYTDDEWRLDQTAHPFMTTPGHGDMRLTTNYRPDDISSLFATMHEFGHGVYEWGVRRSRRGRRSAPASRSACTSLRAERGRTSSGAAARSGATSIRGCRSTSPSSGRRRGGVLSRGEQGAAVPHPDRCGRGHLQPAHHPAVRAGAGPDRGARRPARPAGGLERADGRISRGRRSRDAAGRAPGHALGRREHRATSRPTRSAT